jgi:hypothetical protein
MDKADQIANGDRPVVQESAQYENCVEIVFPADGRTVVLEEQVAMTMFAEMMRVVTGESVDWVEQG